MKLLKQILILFVFLGIQYNVRSQEIANAITSDPTSYWQISSRVGYDFLPLYKNDFKYISYKGGIMAGLSLNRYWKHWGFQLDGDFIKNAPTTNFPNPSKYFIKSPAAPRFIDLDISSMSDPITRTFVGIGPAYKYQSKDNKLTAEVALMGGLGIVNGGQILALGNYADTKDTVKNLALAYNSGFDHAKGFSFKSQIRGTYFFNENWGVNLGFYFINHFKVAQSKNNPMLISNGIIPDNNGFGIYNYELYQFDYQGTLAFGDESLGSTGGWGEYNRKEFKDNFPVSVASIGGFVGLSYRFYHSSKPKSPKVGKGSTCLQVTAKDKYTQELIPNTDVALKNDQGEIIKTAKTDAFGMASFCDLKPDNYKIDGIFNDVKLDGNVVSKSEFVTGQTLKKDIIYSDRSFIIKGKSFICNTTKPLPGINVILENQADAIRKSTITDAQGNFSMTISEKGTFNLYGQLENYFSQTEIVNSDNYNRDKNLFIKLEICNDKVECGKAIKLKNILFDLDKFNIRPDAQAELNKLVSFLQSNPTVNVELGSHTDCRSSSEYNLTLSQNRANASVDYIVSKGIDKSRIFAIGYGEGVLLNKCADGVSCTEAEHAINRRTEFKVICPDNK